MSERITFRTRPGGEMYGRISVPGDKSVSHRAVMFGALADGLTEISNFLQGEDCLATLRAFQAMGVSIDRDHDCLRVNGVGLHGLRAAAGPLDLGNSGTSMRLLSGLCAGQSFDTVLTGDSSLMRRPMRRVTEPLARMGALIETSEGGTAPLCIHGGRTLTGIDYDMPIASAQVKSCLLLAGLYAQGRTTVHEPGPSRDHTERMLAAFDYPVERARDSVSVRGGGCLTATRIVVPGDLSSATFFLVGAAIVPGSDLYLENVGLNPTRAGAIEILRLMGADIGILNERDSGGEPIADLRVKGGDLHGIRIPPRLVALSIDEFPALFVAAACAEGETVLTDAAELRVKESDRIQVMVDGLIELGIAADARPDGAVIRGGPLRGGHVDSEGDHRVAMAFAMAGLRARESIFIDNCANVATSFPGFIDTAAGAGFHIAVKRGGSV